MTKEKKKKNVVKAFHNVQSSMEDLYDIRQNIDN